MQSKSPLQSALTLPKLWQVGLVCVPTCEQVDLSAHCSLMNEVKLSLCGSQAAPAAILVSQVPLDGSMHWPAVVLQ